jgi:hypothetical protein
MRTVIVCLTLILASWGVAAEQAKSPKKVTKTVLVKPVPKPKGKSAANHEISRKKTKPAASKPNHVAAQKSNASKVKKTSALKRTSDRVAPAQTDGHKNITVAFVKPAAKPERPAQPKSPPANELFGSVTVPAALASRSIGFYTRGCLAGGVALPTTGENWQKCDHRAIATGEIRGSLIISNGLRETRVRSTVGLDSLLVIFPNRGAGQRFPAIQVTKWGSMSTFG